MCRTLHRIGATEWPESRIALTGQLQMYRIVHRVVCSPGEVSVLRGQSGPAAPSINRLTGSRWRISELQPSRANVMPLCPLQQCRQPRPMQPCP
jgi:hypothetical protein